ncbi:MAG: peptidoglycan-binding protein [Acidobacteriota bacterium]|nr:peptidoglycan-binding protein [Acidobacteriota bacterium]
MNITRIFLILLCFCTFTLEAKARHRSHSPAKAAQSWRSRQLAPSADRYREIQEALASKGYLKSPPTGVWDQESAGALRRFQEEQNLQATGRVNSLSLIALGLGPKTEPSSRVPALAPAQPQAEH